MYSRLSLSQLSVSQITAYLEVKIWSLFSTWKSNKGNKILWKEEKLLLRSNFSSFQHYFQYNPYFRSQSTCSFVKCGFLLFFPQICKSNMSRYGYLGSISENLLEFKFSVGCASDWRPGGRRFDPRRGRQHSFAEIDHRIFSTVILSLPLIQEGQLSVYGERMCTILVNRLED